MAGKNLCQVLKSFLPRRAALFHLFQNQVISFLLLQPSFPPKGDLAIPSLLSTTRLWRAAGTATGLTPPGHPAYFGKRGKPAGAISTL